MSLEQPRISNGPDGTRRPAASRIVTKDSTENPRHSFASYTTCEEDLPDVFADMDDQCMIEEATVMDAREVTIETPKLPEKSALRGSRFLGSLKINTSEPANDPHDVYLSSEEDASSSADDFSDYDYDYDSNSDESEKSPMRRRSQEDTARAVSVIFVGRPCVVDLASGRRSVSPIRRPRTRASSPSIRTSSIESRPSHPPRKSSLASTVEMPRESPSFLSQDPFATSNYKLESSLKETAPAGSSPRLPKTPTAAFHRFQKSLSLVRKRSRPNLKDAATRDSLTWSTVSASTTDLTLNTRRPSEEEQQSPERPEEPLSAVTTPPQTPVTYNDIITSSRRNSVPRLLTKQPPSTQPASPSPVGVKRGILNGLSMNRRRSMRIKS